MVRSKGMSYPVVYDNDNVYVHVDVDVDVDVVVYVDVDVYDPPNDSHGQRYEFSPERQSQVGSTAVGRGFMRQ